MHNRSHRRMHERGGDDSGSSGSGSDPLTTTRLRVGRCVHRKLRTAVIDCGMLHNICVMPRHIKLTYFNIPGRAELSRLAFVAGGVAFDDYRPEVTEDDFVHHDLKPTLPLGQLPVLEVDGVLHPQSNAIARYAAKLGGLYPEDPEKAMKLDSVLETIADLRNTVGDIRWGVNDEATKAMKTKKYLEHLVPSSLHFIERSLEGTFLFGDELSLADLAVFDIEKNSIKAAFPDFDTSQYPKIEALIAAVLANKCIAAYVAQQPWY